MTEQEDIITRLGTQKHIDVDVERERRIGFLCELLIANNRKSLVLGISGGVDSLAAGYLCQQAAQRARSQGHEARFIAMRLPYGVQRDEEDAQQALAFIGPDTTTTVDIKPASDSMLAALKAGGTSFLDAGHEDFTLGNIKARQRMIAQYAVAGATDGLVIGTDQAAEALMGFFTKHGDGACDAAPLTGLNKRQVRALVAAAGAPDTLVFKVPTADLESLVPLKPDELAFGVRYDEIDDFLEGKPIDAGSHERILAQYRRTAHKRALPVTPPLAPAPIEVPS